MLVEVVKEKWIDVTEDTKRSSIYIDPFFLEPIAKAFNYSLKYFLKYENDRPVLGFACFTSGRKIKVPTHFIYSGLWWNIDNDSIKYRDNLIQAITELKTKYTSIEFRLPPEVNDIRPFQWQGFAYKVNYTYLNPVEGLHFGYTLRARLKKSEQAGILTTTGSSFNKVWNHQNYDLKRFNFSDTLLTKLETIFSYWHQHGYLRIYEASLNDQIIGSSCVLIDKKQSQAFNLLLSSANSHYQTEVHPALYNFILADLKNSDVSRFDLYGADLKGVADFKSRFRGTLTPHFTVKYSASRERIASLTESVKDYLRKLKSRLI